MPKPKCKDCDTTSQLKNCHEDWYCKKHFYDWQVQPLPGGGGSASWVCNSNKPCLGRLVPFDNSQCHYCRTKKTAPSTSSAGPPPAPLAKSNGATNADAVTAGTAISMDALTNANAVAPPAAVALPAAAAAPTGDARAQSNSNQSSASSNASLVDHADSDTPPPQLERRKLLLSCPPSPSQNIITNNTKMAQQGARLLVPSKTNDRDHSHGKTDTAAATTIAAANNRKGQAKQDQSINEYGVVVVFGDNEFGQLGCGDNISQSFTPIVLDTLSPLKVTMVASSFMHSLALTTEGKVYSWGKSDDGNLGRKDDTGSSPSLVTGFHPSNHGPNGTVDGANIEAKIIQITAGQGHSLALSAAGDIYMWGTYSNADKDEFYRHVPPQDDTRPSTGYKDMSLLEQEDDPKIYHPPRGFQDWPVFVSGLTQKAKKISTGACFNAALMEDNTIVTWGIDTSGELARSVPKLDRRKMNEETLLSIVEREHLTPKPPTWAVLSKMKHVSTMSCGGYHLLVVTSEGSKHAVYSSGLNSCGQLGLGDVVNRNSLHEVEYFATHSIDISTVEGGEMFSCFVDSTGRELYTCGSGSLGQLGIAVDDLLFSHQTLPRHTPLVFANRVSDIIENNQPTISQVSCGNSHVLALACDGAVYSWGFNEFGMCGHVGPEVVPHPKMIETSGAFSSGALLEFQHVSGGVLHSVAIVNRNYYYNILTDFYKKHDKTKIPNVPMILRKYQGKEQRLFGELAQNYKTRNPLALQSRLVPDSSESLTSRVGAPTDLANADTSSISASGSTVGAGNWLSSRIPCNEGDWKCAICTQANMNADQVCKVCESPNPKLPLSGASMAVISRATAVATLPEPIGGVGSRMSSGGVSYGAHSRNAFRDNSTKESTPPAAQSFDDCGVGNAGADDDDNGSLPNTPGPSNNRSSSMIRREDKIMVESTLHSLLVRETWHASEHVSTHNEAQNAIGYITTALHHFQAQIVAKEEKITSLNNEISGDKEMVKKLGLAVQEIASLYREISEDTKEMRKK